MPGVDLRSPAEVHEFWFSERARRLWFEKDQAFDDEIRGRFGATVAAACAGELGGWAAESESCLQLLVLLDQFHRNIFHGTLRAFTARLARRSGTAKERRPRHRPRARPTDAARPTVLLLYAVRTQRGPGGPASVGDALPALGRRADGRRARPGVRPAGLRAPASGGHR